MDAQFTSIYFFPVCIQIHNHRIFSAAVVAKLVEMFFVECPFLIKSVVKLVARNSGIAVAVQVTYKCIHQIKKGVFILVVVRTVEPADAVSAHRFVSDFGCNVSRSRKVKFVIRKKRKQVFFQMCRQ